MPVTIRAATPDDARFLARDERRRAAFEATAESPGIPRMLRLL